MGCFASRTSQELAFEERKASRHLLLALINKEAGWKSVWTTVN